MQYGSLIEYAVCSMGPSQGTLCAVWNSAAHECVMGLAMRLFSYMVS